MALIEYPWRWLEDEVGGTFVFRYPWMDAARRAVRTGERICLLLPEAIGPLTDWAEWLINFIGQDHGAICLTASGNFREVTQILMASYQVGEDEFMDGYAADWARTFLPACRRRMPHIETVPLIVIGADDACAAGLADLVAAQRALGYTFTRPVLLRRTAPPGWDFDVIRFGLPQPAGDLHRINPAPERDIALWTKILLALTVVWEAGAQPWLAEELWEQLRLGRTLSLREVGFDAWLDRQLNEFAGRNLVQNGAPLPEALAFGPSATVDDKLWQEGSVAYEGGLFDVIPLRSRLWIDKLQDNARESLRRRRLTNVPLARWLSAWATSIEESLRVAALQAGSPRFRQYLKGQPARSRLGTQASSRWEELAAPDDIAAIDLADFGDLAAFVAQAWPNVQQSLPLATLLEQCRLARNRVVHERKLFSRDLIHITRIVDWLSEHGLM
jgi:hypothetical protein